MRANFQVAVIALILAGISACTPFPPALECIDVPEADCLTARNVASDVLGVAADSVAVVVTRYRPDFSVIGRPDPDFSAYVAIRATRDGPARIVLVIRQHAGESMTGQYVAP